MASPEEHKNWVAVGDEFRCFSRIHRWWLDSCFWLTRQFTELAGVCCSHLESGHFSRPGIWPAHVWCLCRQNTGLLDLLGADFRWLPAVTFSKSVSLEECRTCGFDWVMTSCIRRFYLVRHQIQFFASVTEAFHEKVDSRSTRADRTWDLDIFSWPGSGSFDVEVPPAEYAVWTLWEMASGEGFRILWFDSGYTSVHGG